MTAPRPATVAFRLPPRPAAFDWLWAGASAGLIFGIAEAAVTVPAGSALDPRLAALILGIDSAVVALGSMLVGGVVRWRGIRISRSGLVGAIVGPLLFGAIAGRVCDELTAGAFRGPLAFSGLMTAALLATAAGLASARLADALEQRGVICSAPYVWGAVALLLAGGERLAHEGHLTGFSGVFSALGMVMLAIALVWAGVEIARRRESHSPRSFGWLLGWFVVLSIFVAALPTLLPWILFDSDAPEIAIGPPNIFVAALPAENGFGASGAGGLPIHLATMARLEVEATTLEVDATAADWGVSALLVDREGIGVVPQLSHAGYLTTAILAGDRIPRALAGTAVDAQPGVRQLLGGSLAWLGAAPLLTGPALPLLRSLGLDSDTRSVDRVAERAKAWLLDWRMDHAAVPFFLLVDFRDAAPPRSRESLLERSDARLGDILEHLLTLGVLESTLVVVTRVDRGAVDAGPQASRILLRTPTIWPRTNREERAGVLAAAQIGEFLIEVSRSDTTTPVAIPEPSGMP